MSTQLSTTPSSSLVTTGDESREPAPATTSYLAVMVVGGILLAAQFPMLFQLGRDLWSREHYQFFPFVLLASGFFIWDGFHRLKGPVRGGNQLICFILVIMSGLALILASLIASGTLAALSFLLTMATVLYGIGGWVLFKECLPAWVILFLAIPLPFKLDDRLITSMQWWVAYANGQILDVLGVEHIIQGTTVMIPGRQLMVEEACSGIHSLFSSLFVALFLSMYSRRGVIHTLLLLTTTVYWVLVGNLLRVLLIVLADVQMGFDLASDPQHSMLSILIFLFIIPLIFSTDRLLLFLSPWASEQMPSNTATKVKPWHHSVLEVMPDLNKSWLASWTIGVLFALIACFQFWVVGRELATFQRPSLTIAKIGENGLPDNILGSQRMSYKAEDRKFNHINGEHSQTWVYAFNRQHACEVSLDYTFTGWHDLSICYTNNGWTITKSRVEGSPDSPTKDQYVRVEMVKPHTGQYGYLLFCLFDENGERMPPPASRSSRLWQERLDNIMARLTGKDVNKMTAPTYQVQLFIPTYGELSEAEKTLAADFYRDIENRMRVLVQKNKKANETSPTDEAPVVPETDLLGVIP